MHIFKYIAIVFLFVSASAFSQPVIIDWPDYKDYKNYVDTRSRNIEIQEKAVFEFPDMGISLRNDFPGGRLNGVKQENDSTLSILITPENYPVNMSPWYAFKIWAENERDIYIKLDYRQGSHRYIPKLSRNGRDWEVADSNRLFGSPGDTTFLFSLKTGKDTLWVAGQEIISSGDTYAWMDSLAGRNFIEKEVFGKTTRGRDMAALSISESDNKHMLVVLSRQHPPELTGYLEMISFVETISRDSRLAERFRSKFRTIVVPVMNPDGVDNGHWRHNMGGVDLNRDWRHFYQPETYSLRKYIKNEVEKHGAKLYFGLDFHSTNKDLFYIKKTEQLPTDLVISWKLLEGVNKKMKGHPFTAESSARDPQTSSNWFINEMGTDAITYEVGDNTTRETIKERGEISAMVLMNVLLKAYK